VTRILRPTRVSMTHDRKEDLVRWSVHRDISASLNVNEIIDCFAANQEEMGHEEKCKIPYTMTNKKGFLSQMLKIVKMEEVLPKQRKGKSGEEAHPLHWRGEKREYHHFVAPTSATTNDGNFVGRCWKFMLDNDFFEDFIYPHQDFE